MIKFSQQGPDGWIVGLGLTIENLRLVGEELKPIAFPAAQIGLGAGFFTLGIPGMAAALKAQLGSKMRSCIELDEGDFGKLLQGEPHTRTLESLGYSRKGEVVIFVGESEEAVIASLRAHGILTEATAVNEVDAGEAKRPWWKLW